MQRVRSSPRSMSLRARLTLWYTTVLAVPLVLLAIGSYLVFAAAVNAHTDAFLRDAISVFATELGAEHRAAPSIDRSVRRTLEDVRFRELDIVVFEDDGTLIAASGPLGRTPNSDDRFHVDPYALIDTLGAGRLTEPRLSTVHYRGDGYRVLEQPLEVDGHDLHLAGVFALAGTDAMLSAIRHLFAIAIPIIIVAAALGGSFIAARGLRHVAVMADRAAQITAHTLHERLPVTGGNELAGLAHSFNALLDRLAHAFEQQRRFMTDASHELRTPTAIIGTEADVTLARQRSEDEYRAALTTVRDASRRLARVVDDIFLLSRADAGQVVMRISTCYLDEVVHDTITAAAPLAERKRVALEVSVLDPAPVSGDADLLGRLALNLLHNAIKHSPESGSVVIGLRVTGQTAALTVEDHGPGIPDHARELIFERFFRIDRARARADADGTAGAGLGLAIARRVAELHGGSLVLHESRPGRTVFMATIPLLAEASVEARH